MTHGGSIACHPQGCLHGKICRHGPLETPSPVSKLFWSADSTAGLRSPGTASPSVQEWHSDVVADLRLDGGGAEPRVEPAGSSPFAEASRQPPALEETVVVTPSRVYHGLTRPGGHR